MYCYGLLAVPRPLPQFYAWMNDVAPLAWWAAAWGITGLVCLAYVFRTHDTPAFMAAVAIKVAWGLMSFFGWLAGVVDRGYVSAVVWLAFAAFVFLIAGGIPAAPPRQPRRWHQWIRY